MKVVRKIVINRPVGAVFEFSINPNNTDKWFAGTGVETTNEWPARLGTIYKNQFGTLEVTGFEKNKIFELSKQNADYHVRYEYVVLGNGATELTYSEYGNDLTEATTMEPLEKLKSILERFAPEGLVRRNGMEL